jgi:DNA-binding CsgD family transcriptional regulator
MEAFSAAAQTPLAECERYVDQADLYVGVFGVRYGSKIPGTDLSFIEAESRALPRDEIPLLLFLIDEDNAEVKPKHFEREQKVLKLIADGSTNQEIADKLTISVKTVERRRANSMGKLNLRNRTELVKYAIRNVISSEARNLQLPQRDFSTRKARLEMTSRSTNDKILHHPFVERH